MKTPTSMRINNARMTKFKLKAMHIVLFDIRGTIIIEWVPAGPNSESKISYRGPMET